MAKYCGNCGNQLKDNDVFCSKCGTSQTQQQNVNNGGQQQNNQYVENKSKLVAGLLQIFLGSFGAGRFYLGYTGMAIGQIAAGNVKTDANGVPLKD